MEYYVKYLDNQPVKIEIDYLGQEKRNRSLKDVGDLISAYKTAVAPRFDSTPADELTLHLPDGATRASLTEDCFALPDSTGTTLRNGLKLERLDALTIDDSCPLVIKSKIPHVIESGANVEDNLKRFKIDFTSKLIMSIMDKNPPGYQILRSNPSEKEARKIITDAKSSLFSATRNAIGLQNDIFLDGALNAGQGQVKSKFFYAFTKTGGVLVAKVYSPASKEAFDHEVLASNAFDHPNIVKFLKSFSIEKGHIIIMPYFPRTVHDIKTQYTFVPIGAIATVARDIYSAVAHIHEKGYCFADVKPSNIVLENQEQGKAVLVDFGATVKLGSKIKEVTDAYCLDYNTNIASVGLDWICFATTLSQLADINISLYATVTSVGEAVNNSSIDPLLKNVITCCLNLAESRSSASDLGAAVSLFIAKFLPFEMRK